MANLSLVFDLLARDNASGPFRNVGNAAERAGSQTSKFGTAMSSAMKLAGGALLGAGLIQGFKALYQAADESRKIGALTGAVLKSTGGAANVSAKQVGDLAAAIAKKTGVDDEAIQSGENLLLTFTNIKNVAGDGNDIFNQTTQIMTDMSVALGKDASSSAILLGKALNDPIKGTGALTKAGVQFTAQQKDQIAAMVEAGDTLGAQKIILAELGKQFGGAAEAASTPLGKLQQRIGDLAEQFGGYLVPAVDKAATFFNDKLLPILSDAGTVANATVVPAFKAIATVVGFLADTFNNLPGPLQVAVVSLGTVAALKGPVTSAMETIALKALYAKDAVGAIGSGFGAVKTAGSRLMGFFGGPWGLAIAGATVGITALVSWLGKSDEATQAAKTATEGYAAALNEAGNATDENVRKAAAKAAQDAGLLTIADKAGISLASVTTAITDQGTSLDTVRGKLEAYIESQTHRVTSDQGVIVSMSAQGEKAQEALAALDLLAGQEGKTTTAQDQLTRATATGAATQQTFAQKTDAARTELDEAKQAIDSYKLSLDILTGNTVSMIEVESQLGAAIRAGTDAIKGLDGSVLNADGTLNVYSESGSKASDVLLDIRNSGNQLIATMREQGATDEEVTRKNADLRASFIKTAGEMGITGANAETLADQILGIPSARNTAITADTAPAEAAIKRFMDQRRTITIGTRTVTARVGTTYDQAGGGYAAGGYTGDGGKYEPKGVVHGGEFVFTKEQTAKAGRGRLAALAKMLQGYARGGWVGGSNLGSIQYPTAADTSGLASGLASAATAAAQAMEPTFYGGGAATASASALVNFGRLLQRMGARVSEHPAFGGVSYGAHTTNSKHYSSRAIDVNTRAGTSSLEQRELSPMVAMARRAGFQTIFMAPGHYNHAHIASYKTGTDYVPNDGLAYLHKGERVVPREQNRDFGGPVEVTGTLRIDGDGLAHIVDGRIVSALTGVVDRGNYNR